MIVRYGGQKGYGFIEVTSEDRSIWFSGKSLPMEFQTTEFKFQLIGKTCTFDIREVEGNKQAHNIRIEIGSDKQILGVVKSFCPHKGYGFITSSFTPGKDLHFRMSDLPDDLKDNPFALSSFQGKVAWCIYHEIDGKPQARKLSFMQGSDTPFDATKNALFVPQYCGTIKSFNAQNGFGFIECGKTYGHWERDVYLNAANLPFGAAIGRKVLFEVECKKGQPQARNVRLGYQGKMQSYGKEKGYGFIACEETYRLFHQDVYVPAEVFANSTCSVLDEVFFELRLDKNGKPQASCILVVQRGVLAEKAFEENSSDSEASTSADLPTSHQTLTCNSSGAPLAHMLIPVLLVM